MLLLGVPKMGAYAEVVLYPIITGKGTTFASVMSRLLKKTRPILNDRGG